MSDEVPKDMEIDPEFYKRMREANIKLERACIDYNNVIVDDRFGKILILIMLIIFFIILYVSSKLTFYMDTHGV